MKLTHTFFKICKYTILTLLLLNAFNSLFVYNKRQTVTLLDLARQPLDIPHVQSKHKGIIIEKIKFLSQKNEFSTDTITRYGILTLRPNALGTIIICHGYLCNKYDVGFLRTLFPNYNSLIFDFRAHGEETRGQYCTMGKDEAFDVIGAVQFVKNHPLLKDQKLFGYGFSMGAVSLIQAQSKQPSFDALILDCPFDSSETILTKGIEKLTMNIAGHEFPLPGREFLRRYAYNSYIQPIAKFFFKILAGYDASRIHSRFELLSPINSIEKITVPCFFIHCKNDEKIPVEAIKSIYSKAPAFKRLWLTQGRGHCDSFFFNPEKYFAKTNHFLTGIINASYFEKKAEKIKEDL